MLKSLAIAAAALALATATPAAAAHFSDTVRVQTTVNYADLDINREAGASALLERIKIAAHRLCAPAARFSKCVHKSVDRAVSDVRSPLLTDIYLGRNVLVSIAQND